MVEERNLLIEEIRSLLALEHGDAALPRLEDALTAGYAHAMGLEAEHWRLEQKLGRIARSLAEEGRADAAEAARLTGLIVGVERDLTDLRTLLSTLRDRARQLRAASAA